MSPTRRRPVSLAAFQLASVPVRLCAAGLRTHAGWLVISAAVAACNGDGTGATGGGGTDSATGSASGTSGGSMSNTATMSGGSMSSGSGSATGMSGSTSASGSGTSGSGTSGSGSASSGTATATTGSGTGSGSASTGSSGTATGGGTATTAGEETGFCDMPGKVVDCYTYAPDALGKGICTPGTQTCMMIDTDLGQWTECMGDVPPEVEVCDGIDNDCNGMDDDGLGEKSCGLSKCFHSVPFCVSGMENDCDPFEGATPEVCNGEDDDCDGDIDEGLGMMGMTCGVGKCEHTVYDCDGGMAPVCDPFEGATDEICNDIDDNCNGQTDEGFPDITCGLGACEHTIDACVNGVPQVCDPYEGADTEVCDGIDNDCDGQTDEDQGYWVCGNGECQQTAPKCVNGVSQPMNTCVPGGVAEICGDKVDNDCDGEATQCGETYQVGTDTANRPIDVVWAVDSSGSMSEEMATVEANVNTFANTLAAANSANALHLIADRGTGTFELCVPQPLAGPGSCENTGDATYNNSPKFFAYDTNGGTDGSEMVHSSNALGRIMQQWKGGSDLATGWGDRRQANSFLAFIVTSDDDGGSPSWVDESAVDECDTSTIYVVDATISNRCVWNDPDASTDYTSLANDFNNGTNRWGFKTFMANKYPSLVAGTDWKFYSIIGGTGTNGLAANLQFSCGTKVENGDEYVKLSIFTGTEADMIPICAANWDLASLANSIANSVPQDSYVLSGTPPGTCGNIDPATITVYVNGLPMNPADWTYDAMTCTVKIINNIPTVGDTVNITYDNY